MQVMKNHETRTQILRVRACVIFLGRTSWNEALHFGSFEVLKTIHQLAYTAFYTASPSVFQTLSPTGQSPMPSASRTGQSVRQPDSQSVNRQPGSQSVSQLVGPSISHSLSVIVSDR